MPKTIIKKFPKEQPSREELYQSSVKKLIAEIRQNHKNDDLDFYVFKNSADSKPYALYIGNELVWAGPIREIFIYLCGFASMSTRWLNSVK